MGKGLVPPVPTWNLCITAGARGGLGHQTQDAAYLHHSRCLGSGHGDCWSSRSHCRRAVQRRGPGGAAGPGAADPWCHTQGQHQGILDKAGAWANWQEEKNKPIREAQLGGHSLAQQVTVEYFCMPGRHCSQGPLLISCVILGRRPHL